MKLAVNNIKLSLDDDINQLKSAAAKKLKIGQDRITSLKIIKESVDARHKPDIIMVYSVLAEVTGKYRLPGNNDIREINEMPREEVKPGDKKINNRPIIIGSGPAGIFAGLILSQNGYKPIVLERGESIEKRTEKYIVIGKQESWTLKQMYNLVKAVQELFQMVSSLQGLMITDVPEYLKNSIKQGHTKKYYINPNLT